MTVQCGGDADASTVEAQTPLYEQGGQWQHRFFQHLCAVALIQLLRSFVGHEELDKAHLHTAVGHKACPKLSLLASFQGYKERLKLA